MGLTRAERVAAFESGLELGEQDSDGFTPITLGNVGEVGLLSQVGEDGWQLVWKLPDGDRWRDNVSRLENQPHHEKAEAWAFRNIATYLAMKEEAEERERGG